MRAFEFFRPKLRKKRQRRQEEIVRAALHGSIEEEVLRSIEDHITRLDGYFVYHADRILKAIERPRAPSLFYTSPSLDAVAIMDGFDLVVPSAEAGLIAFLVRHGIGAIEPGVRAIIKRHLSPGTVAVAVDAGANIGLHSVVMAAAVGPEGRVFCFEPLPHLADALRRTLRLNGFGDRAVVEELALGEVSGKVTLNRAAHGAMSSLYGLPEHMAVEPIRVCMSTLDERIPPSCCVALVKMDVEGAEPIVWRGMRRIVGENRDIVMVLEWSASHFRRSGHDPDAFMEEIRMAGFHPYLIDDGSQDGRLAPLREAPSVLEGKNLFFSRREL